LNLTHGGVKVADKVTPPNDLTSTLNLRQLRSIPGSIAAEELYKSLSVEQQQVVNSLPNGVGILLVLRGAGVGGRYLLDAAETKIGRDINNEICLDDITVSRSHALISRSAEGYFVKDLGSLNGTYLNAVSIKETKVANGDEIQIGKYHLTLFIGKK
jgi:pSer/pThr/pTyr-binding forkhead associated (FHA) protein